MRAGNGKGKLQQLDARSAGGSLARLPFGDQRAGSLALRRIHCFPEDIGIVHATDTDIVEWRFGTIAFRHNEPDTLRRWLDIGDRAEGIRLGFSLNAEAPAAKFPGEKGDAVFIFK